MTHFEIERKFLIEMPEIDLLKNFEGVRILEIVQTYTTRGVRLRKQTEKGETVYISTEKRKVSDLTRIEEEREIGESEYRELLAFADPDLSPIKKTRYALPFGGKIVEIDVFPFWEHQAFCEVELQSEEEKFSLPEFVKVIRELTSDKAYRNYSLAKEVPQEEIF